MPLFSCVVPVKGARPYMDEAMESLRNQGMGEDLEVIVQDADVEPDKGQSDAFNKGFAKAKGEWLFWLNADDVLLPGTLKKVAALIRRKGAAVSWISGNVAYLNASGNVIRCAWDVGWKSSCRGLPVQVYGPSSFFRRELLTTCGGFDTSLHYTMDVDLWCRFRRAGYWHEKIPALFWGFRIHPESKTHEAQMGGWPKPIADEHKILDARYGFASIGLMRRWASLTRLLNGSYFKAWRLTRRLKGCMCKDLTEREVQTDI